MHKIALLWGMCKMSEQDKKSREEKKKKKKEGATRTTTSKSTSPIQECQEHVNINKFIDEIEKLVDKCTQIAISGANVNLYTGNQTNMYTHTKMQRTSEPQTSARAPISVRIYVYVYICLM